MIVLFLFLINYYLFNFELLPSYDLYVESNLTIKYETHWQKEDKPEITFILDPFKNEYMFGNIYMSLNIPLNMIDNINDYPSIEVETNEISSYSISLLKIVDTIYLNLIGYFYGKLMILDPNKNISLNINESYYFNYIKLNKTNYLSFKIENLEKNIFLNLFSYDNNCSGIKIYQNDELIPCEEQIDNYIQLKSNNEYFIEYYPDIAFFLGINFFNNKIISFDKKTDYFITSNHFVFYFILGIKNNSLNNKFAIFVDSKSRFTISGGFLKEDIDRNNLNDSSINLNEAFEEENCRYFILNKINNDYNYIIFGIKIYSNKGEKFNVKLVDSIVYIKDYYFIYQLSENKNYLFLLDEEFYMKYIKLKSAIFLSYEKENKMKTIVYENDECYDKNSLFLKLQNIEGIYFDKGENGIFKFEFINQTFSSLLKENYNHISYINSANIYNFFPKTNNYFIYFNVITGNLTYDLLNNYENVKVNNNNSIFKQIKNDTSFLYTSGKSSSMVELFYETKYSYYYLINNSQIILLRNKLNYSLIINDYDKILIKLVAGSSTNIYHNNKKYILNKNNNKIEIILNKINLIICNGYNSLLNIFLPINKYLEYSIQKNCEKCEFHNVEELFITPIFKDNNSIILKIIIESIEDDKDFIAGFYLMDFNKIPYTRNKQKIFRPIYLKNKIENKILLKNIIQSDKVNHDYDESFFIYFIFNNKIKNMIINIEYIDAIYLNNLEPLLIKKGRNKIFLGNNLVKYIHIDKCSNNNYIKYLFINNGINSPEKIFNPEKERIINISEYSNKETSFLEINSEEDLLIFLSKSGFVFLDGFILDYNINFDYDEENIFINFNSITFSSQVEYIILISEKKDSLDLNNHCIIQTILDNKIYIYKEIIYANEEDGYFDKEFKYENILSLNKEYILMIIAKEYNDYILYKYYKPKEFILQFEYGKESTEESKNSEKEKNIAVIIIPIIISIIIIIIIIIIIYKCKNKKEDEKKIELVKLK